MSMHPLNELLTRWSQAKLTVEQAIGQLIQHQLAFTEHLNALEKRLRALEQPAPTPKS